MVAPSHTPLAKCIAHRLWRMPVPLPEDGTPLYERLPSESAKCYAYFRTYLDLGPFRTQRETAKRHGRSERLMWVVSHKFHWQARARAFDDFVDRAMQGNAVQRHADIASKSLDLVEAALDALNPATMTPKETARLFEIAVRVGNLSRGLATEHTATHLIGNIAVSHDLTERARQRIAEQLARIASNDDEPTAEDIQRATVIEVS